MLQKQYLLLTLFTIGISICNAQSDSLKQVLGSLGKKNPQIDASVQNNQATSIGNVEIVADSAIVNLEKSTRKFKETKGYRVQIFLGSVEQAKSERNKYLSLGQPYSIYSKQIVPEQALQIGDFINRMEMEKNLVIIQKYYPKAFGVVEFIEPPKFNSKKK